VHLARYEDEAETAAIIMSKDREKLWKKCTSAARIMHLNFDVQWISL